METHNSVLRYPHKFSIENILSKPVNSAFPNRVNSHGYSHVLSSDKSLDNRSDVNVNECKKVRPNSGSSDKSEVPTSMTFNCVPNHSDGRVSSPESSFTEEPMEDGKSDIASEDDNGM